jgi:threonylcarbamoyladenosine tRNA methylthiotransferase MtaB
MPQVPGRTIKMRAKTLRDAGEAALQRRLSAEVGATRHVLVESKTQGRTEHFMPVALSGHDVGAVHAMTITAHDGNRLIA